MHLVKRILAISLLVLYVFTTTEIHQLLKLKTFVEHYHEHQTHNSFITMIEFLQIHYGQSDVVDADYERDMELPFKSCSSSFISFQMIMTEVQHYTSTPFKDFYITQTFIPMRSVLTPSYLSAIWQPPRFV